MPLGMRRLNRSMREDAVGGAQPSRRGRSRSRARGSTSAASFDHSQNNEFAALRANVMSPAMLRAAEAVQDAEAAMSFWEQHAGRSADAPSTAMLESQEEDFSSSVSYADAVAAARQEAYAEDAERNAMQQAAMEEMDTADTAAASAAAQEAADTLQAHAEEEARQEDVFGTDTSQDASTTLDDTVQLTSGSSTHEDDANASAAAAVDAIASTDTKFDEQKQRLQDAISRVSLQNNAAPFFLATLPQQNHTTTAPPTESDTLAWEGRKAAAMSRAARASWQHGTQEPDWQAAAAAAEPTTSTSQLPQWLLQAQQDLAAREAAVQAHEAAVRAAVAAANEKVEAARRTATQLLHDARSQVYEFTQGAAAGVQAAGLAARQAAEAELRTLQQAALTQRAEWAASVVAVNDEQSARAAELAARAQQLQTAADALARRESALSAREAEADARIARLLQLARDKVSGWVARAMEVVLSLVRQHAGNNVYFSGPAVTAAAGGAGPSSALFANAADSLAGVYDTPPADPLLELMRDMSRTIEPLSQPLPPPAVSVAGLLT